MRVANPLVLVLVVLSAACNEGHARSPKGNGTNTDTSQAARPDSYAAFRDSIERSMCADIDLLHEVDSRRAPDMNGHHGVWLMVMSAQHQGERYDGKLLIPGVNSRVRTFEVFDRSTPETPSIEVRTFDDRLPGYFCTTGVTNQEVWADGTYKKLNGNFK